MLQGYANVGIETLALIAGIAFVLAAASALAQSTTYSSGGAGMIGGDGAGMIGGPAASAGITGSGVIQQNNQPHNPAPPPPVGAGYGTPGNVGNLGAASNSGAGAGVQSDIRTGIPTSPNVPTP